MTELASTYSSIALISSLCILLTFSLVFVVGFLRGKHKIIAPAITGHPEFEKAYRVHQNTLENLVIFLPTLWLSAIYTGVQYSFWAGIVWLVARILFAVGYFVNPNYRLPGFAISIFTTITTLLLTIYNIIFTF